ncbi:MAG: DUF433 domain-containing protein [Bdellovibrio sp.]|nr:DUF433 domain-containing protein [Bdellovibrio sp.]
MKILSGIPVFEGTRVPVQTLMDYLEGGSAIDSFLEDFPTVSKKQVLQFLDQISKKILKKAA